MNLSGDDLAEPIWSHLEALRHVFIRSLLVIGAGFVLTFCFYQHVFSALTWPMASIPIVAEGSSLLRQELKFESLHNPTVSPVQYAPPPSAQIFNPRQQTWENAPPVLLIPAGESLDLKYIKPHMLAIFSPVEGMITSLKVCLGVALVATAPIWLYFVLQFIMPGLKTHEKRLLVPFVGLSTVFLVGGLLFAYFVTLPLSNAFLWAFNAELGHNLWSLSSYLDYTLFLLLANALAFEASLVLFFLVHLGVITTEWMVAHRRHMVVAALVLGALFTPPDIASQLMLAIPLIGLYELAILYARGLVRFGASRGPT